MKAFLFILAATVFETVGDALLRIALHETSASARVGFFVLGGVLVTLYGTTLNLAPVEFATAAGIYIATLFVMFQITNFAIFHIAPTLSVVVGGTMIVAGGVVIAVWR